MVARTKEDPSVPFAPEALAALADLKKRDKRAFEGLRAQLKRAGCQISSLEESLSEEIVVTGSLVVETVFGLPGTGRYLVQGAINRDYTLVMGMITVYGAITLVLNLVADLIYGWLDPTVRHE